MPTSLTGSMNLMMLGESTTPNNASISLFAMGGTNSGNYQDIPLYINSVSGVDNVVNSSLNLFVTDANSATTTSSMNLWTQGEWASIANWTTLYQANTGSAEEVTLSISGEGIEDGAAPFSAQMNLFLGQVSNEYVALYLRGPGDILLDSTDLYVFGVIGATGVVNLSIPSVRGFSSLANNLYTSGY